MNNSDDSRSTARRLVYRLAALASGIGAIACGLPPSPAAAPQPPADAMADASAPPVPHIQAMREQLWSLSRDASKRDDPASLELASFMTYAGATTRSIAIRGVRIAGGEPFDGIDAIGAILYPRYGAMVPGCTASVIGKRTLLTAAHCVYGFKYEKMVFATGWSSWSPTAQYRVVGGAYHEKYDPSEDHYGTNDVAVLYLEDDLPPSVGRLELPAGKGWVKSLLEARRPLSFVGYGFTIDGQGNKVDLGYKARVIMPPREWDDTNFKYGGKDGNTCNGDSGGPAVDMSSTPYRIVGITSWGDGPCVSFGVDMRVDAYLDWIGDRIDVARSELSPSPTSPGRRW